ncbi:MAG TPA: hypothetical protein VF763_08465 [Candidatus Limnocylindrales bacterium]
MDPRERLRLRLAGSACARCGRPYRGDDVRVLAQRESLAFVRSVCRGCGGEALDLLTDLDDDPASAPSLALPPRPAAPDAVRLEDVRAMRAFLARYRGDVRGLLDGRGQGSQGHGDRGSGSGGPGGGSPSGRR